MGKKHKKARAGNGIGGEVQADVAENVLREASWKLGKSEKKRSKGKIVKPKYIDELVRLQFELIKLQDWVQREGLKVVVIFEGRDAAGKGGVIKRITESLNPRVCKVVALGTPTERERGQWYFQRYVPPFRSRSRRTICAGMGGRAAPLCRRRSPPPLRPPNPARRRE